MGHTEQEIIQLVVSEEQILYTPFSPEAELNSLVKDYIKSKAIVEDARESFGLNVISQETLDEERFRTAVSNWIKEEKAFFRIKEKETLRTFVGLLVFGSIFIILSLALQKKFEVLKYSLLPILGSLALSKATGILIIDIPTIKAQRRMINEMEKKSVITFEYVHEETASPDEELV